MSSRSPRKKRRREPTEEEEEPEQVEGQVEQDAETEETEAERRQNEVWDAFKEAHYETLEQLPLTLRRQLSLLRQMDEQTQSYLSQILPTLFEYIGRRRDIAQEDRSSESLDVKSPTIPSKLRRTSVASSSTSDKLRPAGALLSTDDLDAVSNRQELLLRIAMLSDEVTHISQEKVNLALSTHDIVERHIRILDQAIEEQQEALERGASQPIIHLPDLVVPKWPGRSQRVGTAVSPIENEQPAPLVVNPVQPSAESRNTHRSKKGKHKAIATAADSKAPEVNKGKETASFTITLPATSTQVADTDEPVYCYCNRISFGEMIACDSDHCHREWFHLGCVGLLTVPKGNWYCEDCISEYRCQKFR